MQNLSCGNVFYLHENKNHFFMNNDINNLALSLDLRQRLGQFENTRAFGHNTILSLFLSSGAPNDNFWKISVGKTI